MSDPNGDKIPLKQLTGIRNVIAPEHQPMGAVEDANNTLIDNEGRHELRPGYALARAGTNITDAYQHDSLDYVILVDDGNLISVDRNLGERVIRSGLTDTTFCWAQIEQRILFAGDHDSGEILNNVMIVPLRFPDPSPPNVTAIAGALRPGVYQIAQAYRHVESNLEGPVSPVIQAIIAPGFGLIIDPGRLPAGYVADLYVSTPDDPALRYLTTTSGSSATLSTDPVLANPVDPAQLGRVPLPTGVCAMEVHESCLFAAVHDSAQDISNVFISEPFAYGWFAAHQAGFAVPGRVLQMASTGAGLLIATDAAILLRDPQDNLSTVLNYGAVSGRPMAKDLKNQTVMIWTKQGAVRFAPAENLFDDKLSVAPGSACSTAILDHRGARYLLALTNDQGTPFNPY